ncbi:hypothetical protein HDE_12462 [Halotydeus destructor]|nr:hypothetical protein HDE_12462 [Halotydeus destructor]
MLSEDTYQLFFAELAAEEASLTESETGPANTSCTGFAPPTTVSTTDGCENAPLADLLAGVQVNDPVLPEAGVHVPKPDNRIVTTISRNHYFKTHEADGTVITGQDPQGNRYALQERVGCHRGTAPGLMPDSDSELLLSIPGLLVNHSMADHHRHERPTDSAIVRAGASCRACLRHQMTRLAEGLPVHHTCLAFRKSELGEDNLLAPGLQSVQQRTMWLVPRDAEPGDVSNLQRVADVPVRDWVPALELLPTFRRYFGPEQNGDRRAVMAELSRFVNRVALVQAPAGRYPIILDPIADLIGAFGWEELEPFVSELGPRCLVRISDLELFRSFILRSHYMAEGVMCQDVDVMTVLQDGVERWVRVGVRTRRRGTPDRDRQAPRLVESMTTALRLTRWQYTHGYPGYLQLADACGHGLITQYASRLGHRDPYVYHAHHWTPATNKEAHQSLRHTSAVVDEAFRRFENEPSGLPMFPDMGHLRPPFPYVVFLDFQLLALTDSVIRHRLREYKSSLLANLPRRRAEVLDLVYPETSQHMFVELVKIFRLYFITPEEEDLDPDSGRIGRAQLYQGLLLELPRNMSQLVGPPVWHPEWWAHPYERTWGYVWAAYLVALTRVARPVAQMPAILRADAHQFFKRLREMMRAIPFEAFTILPILPREEHYPELGDGQLPGTAPRTPWSFPDN